MNRIKETKIRWIEWAVLIGFMASLLFTNVLGFSSECKSVSQSVLRLHIIANSNSDEDQKLKLDVRDAILRETGNMFESEGDLAQAKLDVQTHLPEIEKIAQDEVTRQGYSYPVKAQMTNMFFNTRTYNNITLPAGRYDALRITIGEAGGHNWWCVLYPPLCVPAAEPDQEVKEALDEEQVDLVEKNPKYDVRFAIVEFFEKWKEKCGWQ